MTGKTPAAKLAAALAAAVIVAGMPPDSSAHHAASGLYEREGSISVSGRVESVFWRNPHVRFSLLVPLAGGGEQRWEIEAGSVNSLERMGVSEDVLEPGGFVTVTGLPGRGGQAIAYARSIVSAEGEQVSLFFTLSALDEHYELERAAEDRSTATDIFRVWVPITVPNTGSGRFDFPLTERARAIRAAWDPANDPALNCVPPGMPAAMDNPYPVEFEDRGDTIVMRLEEWDGVRTIHMGDPAAAAGTSTPAPAPSATAPSPPAPSPMGYSVGRWDGDSLIVETSAISYPYFDDLGTPQSDAIRVSERFDLDRDAGSLNWTGTIVDPETFTEPVVLEIEWRYIPGNALKTFACALPD